MHKPNYLQKTSPGQASEVRNSVGEMAEEVEEALLGSIDDSHVGASVSSGGTFTLIKSIGTPSTKLSQAGTGAVRSQKCTCSRILWWIARIFIVLLISFSMVYAIITLDYFDSLGWSTIVTVVSMTWNISITLILTIEESIGQVINNKNNNNSKCSCKDIIMATIIGVWSKRNLYIPLITHLTDISTDAGVLVEYYLNYSNKLFIASLCIILVYRIISSCLVYKFSGKFSDFILQFCDCYIYKILILSWKNELITTSWIQQYIQLLESIFESGPQIMISAYLIITEQTETSWLIWFSFSFSLFTIANRAIQEDDAWFRPESMADELDFEYKCNPKKWECNLFRCFCCKWRNILRRIWRYIDVLSRVLILTLIWIIIGGWYLVGLLIIEFLLFFVITNLICGKFQTDNGINWELYLINGLLTIYPNANDLRGFSAHSCAACMFSWMRHIFNIIITCYIIYIIIYNNPNHFHFLFIVSIIQISCVILNLFLYWLFAGRQCCAQGDITNPMQPWKKDPKYGWNWTYYEASTTRDLLGCRTVEQIIELQQFEIKTIDTSILSNSAFWSRCLEPLAILNHFEDNKFIDADVRNLRSSNAHEYTVANWIATNPYFSKNKTLMNCKELVTKLQDLGYSLDAYCGKKYAVIDLAAWYQTDTKLCQALLETGKISQESIEYSARKVITNTYITYEQRQKMIQLWKQYGMSHNDFKDIETELDQYLNNLSHPWLHYIPGIGDELRDCCKKYCPCFACKKGV